MAEPVKLVKEADNLVSRRVAELEKTVADLEGGILGCMKGTLDLAEEIPDFGEVRARVCDCISFLEQLVSFWTFKSTPQMAVLLGKLRWMLLALTELERGTSVLH